MKNDARIFAGLNPCSNGILKYAVAVSPLIVMLVLILVL